MSSRVLEETAVRFFAKTTNGTNKEGSIYMD